MRMLLAGDTHRRLYSWRVLTQIAKMHECTAIVQLGDFGFWPRDDVGADYLKYVQKFLVEADMMTLWLDGNHEDHHALRDGWQVGTAAWPLSYVPRGQSWEWDGVKFLACGGAYSIDKDARKKGYDWFPEELITDADVAKCAEAGPVDVLLTHDTPEGHTGWVKPGVTYNGVPYKHDAVSRRNRERVREIAETAQPDVCFHGHYHHRFTVPLKLDSGKVMRVEGLAADGEPDSYVVFDTEKFRQEKEAGQWVTS